MAFAGTIQVIGCMGKRQQTRQPYRAQMVDVTGLWSYLISWLELLIVWQGVGRVVCQSWCAGDSRGLSVA